MNYSSCQIQEALRKENIFIRKVDLQKSKELLEAAYNDNQGVTAEFNLNMLSNLNQPLKVILILFALSILHFIITNCIKSKCIYAVYKNKL
jgi:hypothetical protein